MPGELMKYHMLAHKRGSDYYSGRNDPGFTLWPNGAILTGISPDEASVIERALNEAVRTGELMEDSDCPHKWNEDEDGIEVCALCGEERGENR